MKNWKLFMVLAIIAIFGIIIGFMACDNSKNDPVLCKCENKEHLEAGQSCNCGGEDCNCSEKPKIKPDTTMLLAFGTNCKVTIKSDDKFLSDEWRTLCVQVVTVIDHGYEVGDSWNKGDFEKIFVSSENATVILHKDFDYNWQVKSGEHITVHIKISSLSTLDFNDVLPYISDDYPGNG